MILAAFGDICGNWPAFRAILGDIDAQGVQTVVHTGNCVVGHPWPNEIIDALSDRHIVGPQGVLDRLLVRFVRKHDTMKQSLAPELYADLEATYGICRSANAEFLRSLPRTVTLHIDGIKTVVFHGTLTNAAESLSESEPDERYQRQREQALAPLLVFGGNEVGFHRTVGDALFVCTGAAGLVTDGESPLARYVLISTETEPWSVEYRAVPYALPVDTE